MKVTRQEPEPTPFIPVVLTLESQEEVDSVFAVLNHALVAKCLCPELHYSYRDLAAVKTEGYKKYHNMLQDLSEGKVTL